MTTKTKLKLFFAFQVSSCNSLQVAYTYLFVIFLAVWLPSESIAQPAEISAFESKLMNSLHPFSENSENAISRYDADWQFLNSNPERITIVHSKSDYSLLLDSIYELSTLGYKPAYYRWYYSYNSLYQIDSVYRYFSIEEGDIGNLAEISTYNAEGQLKRYVRLQLPSSFLYNPADSNSIQSIVEENSYEDGKLIRQYIKTIFPYGEERTNTFYFYDNKGKLVYDSICIERYSEYTYYKLSDYLYNSDGRLQYNLEQTIRSNSKNWHLKKYSYERTDTSLLTLIKHVYSYDPLPPVLDSISNFDITQYYYETFDNQGRRATLEVHPRYDSINTSRDYGVFKAEYEYSKWGDLLHASYYHYGRRGKEGKWPQTTQINNTYDEEGNILLHETSFYDYRLKIWVMQSRKEYFYSPVSNALGIEENSFTALELYPNPAHSILTIKGIYNSSAIYTIADLSGRIIAREMLVKETIDISSYEPGQYVIIIETDSGVYSGKFVKY